MRSINRIFFRFLIAYVVLILIPLITGIAMNRAIVMEYEQHVKITHLSHLKKTQDLLESFVEDIKWSTYQLAGNTKLLRLIADKNQNLSHLERSSLIRETMMVLNRSLLYNTSFNSIFYIYLKNQDIIITPYSVYTHSDFDDSVNFFKMENISSKDWHASITEQYYQGKILPVRTMIIEDFKNKKMIPYVQTLPIDNSRNVSMIDGVIVYLIGEADFIKFLNYEDLPSGGWTYIADDQNKIISLVSNSVEEIEPVKLDGDEGMIDMVINNQKMFIIYTTSERNSWKYVSVMPEKWVLKSVVFYQILSFSVMFIALLICLGAAYALSRKWSKPLTSTLKSITSYLKNGSLQTPSFESLPSNVNELIHKSEDMHDELLSQQVFVHNAFVNRIINGFFKDEKDIGTFLTHLGFRLTENNYSVAVLSLTVFNTAGTTKSFEEMNRIKNLFKTKLQQSFPVKTMISEQENTNFVLILMTESEDLNAHEKLIQDSFHHFFEDVPSFYKEGLIVALGGTVDSMMKIHSSYIQAQDVLSGNHVMGGLSIIHYSDIDMKLEEYYFPIEMESRLINSVKAGDMDTLKNLLDILYKENLENRSLERKKLRLFYSNLQSAFLRIKNQLSESVRNELDLENFEADMDFDNLKNLCLKVCLVQNGYKRSHNRHLLDRVKEYLEINHKNNNLSLFLVADYFSITESYLSYFFKEQTGINFSTFLEKIRMDQATDLLLNTNEPIQCIAGRVGYNSDKTFRRVFKKTLRISPSRYRQENRST